MMCVGDCYRERIGGIRSCDLDARQQSRNHRMDLCLVRAPGPDHGLLDDRRGIFANIHTGSGRTHQHHPSRLAQLQGRLWILVDENLFNRGPCGTALRDQRVELIGENGETLREWK